MKRQPVWRQVVALLAAVVLGTSETAEAGTSITFNGTSYTVPAIGDASWGSNVSTYLIAIASGALQKSGGTFTLTAETDFGATYGLKAPYFKSKTATIAAAGVLRMGNNGDSVSWRNAANGADLALKVNASDNLLYNGNQVYTNAASTTANGYLSSTDWNTFNTKVTSVAGRTGAVTLTTPDVTEAGSTNIYYSNARARAAFTGTAPVAYDGSGTFSMAAATTSVAGYLSTGDWTAFNSVARVKATGTVNGYLSSTDWTTFNSISTVKATGTVNGYLSSTDWTTFNGISAVKATTTVNGYLSSTDWTTFNAKQPTVSVTAPVTFVSNTVAIPQVSGTVNGYLSSTDWSSFNSLTAGSVPSSRSISTTAPLTGGGTLAADRTLAISAATTSGAGSVSNESVVAEAALNATCTSSVSMDVGTWGTIDSCRYKCGQIGAHKYFRARLESTTAASGLQELHFALPGGCPTWTGFSTTGASEWDAVGAAVAATTTGGTPLAGTTLIFDSSGSPIVYAYLTATQASRIVIMSVDYH